MYMGKCKSKRHKEVMAMVRLKAERLNRGWTQQELGFYASVSAADISKIERGWLKPYPGPAVRLAQVLGLKPEELLEEVVLGAEATNARA
jgi:transcriptional regulator with XRE-family HTH domain